MTKKKQLLIESTDFVSKVKLSKSLKESVKLSQGKSGTLVVRNVPCTILNRRNQNGRIYSTEVLQEAIDNARMAIQTKSLLSQACEHPEGSFCSPTTSSHVIIDAYIKKDVNLVVEGKKGKFDVLFMDWEVLNTEEGKNLRALFEAECSIGTSIRGVGDLNGDMVENYELFGCDCVGNPSSSTFTRMPISESVKVDLVDKESLTEGFTVTTTSTDVAKDLENATRIQLSMEDARYGTVVKIGTKVDQENDPKTGAQTKITTVEGETSDDVQTLDQALAMAKNAFLNGSVHVDTVTIENIKEEETTNESTETNEDRELNEELEMGADRFMQELNDMAMDSNPEIINDIQDAIQSIKNKDVSYEKFKEEEKKAKEEKDKKDKERKENPENNENEEKEEMEEGWKGALTGGALGAELAGLAGVALGGIPVGLALGGLGALYGGALGHAIGKIYDVHKNMLNALIHKKGSLEFTFTPRPFSTDQFIVSCKVKNGERISDDTTALMTKEEAKKTWYALYASGDYKVKNQGQVKAKKESTYDNLVEAKEDDKDSKEGRKFVLKAPNGFVGMDGNALVFKEDPKEALHFIVGKEESGLVHLSGVEKILDTMGVYDVEKYYRKPENEISSNETPVEEGLLGGIAGDALGATVDGLEGASAGYSLGSDIQDGITEETMKEANGSNTKYMAEVHIEKEGGASETNTIPVSATEPDSILAEVSNLWAMKTKKGDGKVTIVVINTETGEKSLYSPNADGLQPVATNESAEDPIEQNGSKLSVKIDDETTVEKDFENETTASVAKSGIEQGKLNANIMLSEEDVRPNYEDVKPGWYIANPLIGVSGPFESKEEALKGLEGFEDQIDVEEITPEDLGMEPENKNTMDEKLFSEPTEPSDDYVQQELVDDVNHTYVVLDNIDWDEEDLVNGFTSEYGDDEDLTRLQSAISELPNEIKLEVKNEDLLNVKSKDELLSILIKKAEEKSGLKIKNANVKSVE